MKPLWTQVMLLIFSFSLFGCDLNKEHLMQENQVKQSSGKGEFIEPDPSDWVKYIMPVREYMHYRTQAVLHNDIHVLWDRYPTLKTNADRKSGVNVEVYEVQTLNQGFTFIDANYSVEGYERIKVRPINENEAIVLIHGGIGYVRQDFEESGGEIMIKLFLEYKDNRWTVVKTDEYTLPEYKEWIKK